jgi:hypothetical protein
MSKYQQFIFESYDFDADSGLLSLHYSLDDTLHFTETYRFAFEFAAYDDAVLDRALQNIFFIAGISYFKRYLPPKIIIKHGQLDRAGAAFWSSVYQKGLGEFWYVNQLDPTTKVTFPVTADIMKPLEHTGQGQVVAIGGGKDSLTTVELLRGRTEQPLATWSMDHQSQLAPQIERIGLGHYWVERSWDKQLLALKNDPDSYSGHVPISAIFGCVGVAVAVLSGRQDVVLSNEQSANEPTLTYRDVEINHQWSKSQAFERGLQRQLLRQFGTSVRYYSFLRPLSEVRIAELFARIALPKYRDVFSSCNRAYVHTSDHMFWCGECPKCAFVFLILTPFVPRLDLEALWGGKNLLLDPSLARTYRQLLGIEGDKPLDCVGEVKESRAAMSLAEKIIPELAGKYTYDLPVDYDYKLHGSHEIPQDMYEHFVDATAHL